MRPQIRKPKKPLSLRTGRGVGVRVLRPDQLGDLLLDLVGLRKAIQRLLGENLLAIEKDLERSGFARGDGDRPDLLVVVVQQILRQTGGSW